MVPTIPMMNRPTANAAYVLNLISRQALFSECDILKFHVLFNVKPSCVKMDLCKCKTVKLWTATSLP